MTHPPAPLASCLPELLNGARRVAANELAGLTCFPHEQQAVSRSLNHNADFRGDPGKAAGPARLKEVVASASIEEDGQACARVRLEKDACVVLPPGLLIRAQIAGERCAPRVRRSTQCVAACPDDMETAVAMAAPSPQTA